MLLQKIVSWKIVPVPMKKHNLQKPFLIMQR